MDIILASTSRYRQKLLERLGISFRCAAPDVDESALPGEAPDALAARLSLAKARSVATQFAGAIVIGSDQVAALGEAQLCKPGSAEAARAQLSRCAGRWVNFSTGLAVLGPATTDEQVHLEPFSVRFRALGAAEIARYVAVEQPLDCAGSFKVEGLGISLFAELRGRDPTSLEGLPLIALSSLLRSLGINIP